MRYWWERRGLHTNSPRQSLMRVLSEHHFSQHTQHFMFIASHDQQTHHTNWVNFVQKSQLQRKRYFANLWPIGGVQDGANLSFCERMGSAESSTHSPLAVAVPLILHTQNARSQLTLCLLDLRFWSFSKSIPKWICWLRIAFSSQESRRFCPYLSSLAISTTHQVCFRWIVHLADPNPKKNFTIVQATGDVLKDCPCVPPDLCVLSCSFMFFLVTFVDMWLLVGIALQKLF